MEVKGGGRGEGERKGRERGVRGESKTRDNRHID